MTSIPRIAELESDRSAGHVTGYAWESARLLHRLISLDIGILQRFGGRNQHEQSDGLCSDQSPVEESDSFLNRLKWSMETTGDRGSVVVLVVP